MKKNNFYIETIHGDYTGYNDPVFFDKHQFDWASKLEQNFDDIMFCLKPLLNEGFDSLTSNPEIQLQLPPKSWKVFPFYINGIKFNKNLKRFGLLASLLETIPDLITAYISVLEPSAKLLPHNGSTNAVMRVHLPLVVPGEYPDCGMNIEGNEISWEEGRIFMFCDMKTHYVQNMTNSRRFILLMDVMRPEFSHLKKKVCVHTTARIFTNILIGYIKGLIGK